MTVLTFQYAFRVIQVHQIWNRGSVFGALVQAPQHLSNFHSDTSVQKNQQSLWVLILKRKIKNTKKKHKKTLQNSLAKASKMQRELKSFWQKSRSHHSDKRCTRKRSEMEGRCVLSSASASTSKPFHAHWLVTPGQNLAEHRTRPRWMITVTNYWILSFHWRVNERHWQTRKSCDVLLVQSQPAVPEENVVLIGQQRDCWHAQKFSPGWDST